MRSVDCQQAVEQRALIQIVGYKHRHINLGLFLLGFYVNRLLSADLSIFTNVDIGLSNADLVLDADLFVVANIDAMGRINFWGSR